MADARRRRGPDTTHEAYHAHARGTDHPVGDSGADPLNPMPAYNPEQTTSPLSLLLFSFLDSVIVLAYKLPHLPNVGSRNTAHFLRDHQDVPERVHHDPDHADDLRRVHICVSHRYLKNGPSGSDIRSFVWNIWLVMGPLAGTTAMQAYYRLSMCILVQVEGLCMSSSSSTRYECASRPTTRTLRLPSLRPRRALPSAR
ncbi:hypothetical protein DFH07DRAFT_220483 [Mycena maculata]|uniref:Uncharacterized protein n=1 Tax=Mycena maculata TaxID=230809 RepID=A0AAD7HV19_9AGAR|nr:hypothetical protein DFH07DRAFT_220483 [Mycena maculata]